MPFAVSKKPHEHLSVKSVPMDMTAEASSRSYSPHQLCTVHVVLCRSTKTKMALSHVLGAFATVTLVTHTQLGCLLGLFDDLLARRAAEKTWMFGDAA